MENGIAILCFLIFVMFDVHSFYFENCLTSTVKSMLLVIYSALPTLKYLLEQKPKAIVLFSHLGKVKTEEDKAKNDLRCVADRLSELVDTKVTFVPVTRGLN